MDLNSVSLNVFVQLANVIFEKEKDAVEMNARNSGLFIVEKVPEFTGDIRQFTEIDRNRYARRKNEGDQSAHAKVQQGYSVNLTAYRVSADLSITYEMRTRNKYQDVIDTLTSLGSQGSERMELDLSHRVTFGTSTTYTDMDGVLVSIAVGDTLSLFNTAHTVQGASATYRNRLPNNPLISRGALELAERQFVEQSINQFGEKIRIKPDLLWTTDDPTQINVVLEYLKSLAAPEAPNSGVENVYKYKYRHVILPLIATLADGTVDSTKNKYWGLASTKKSTAHLLVWEEPRLRTPAEGNNGDDFSTDDWTFGVRAGYGIAITNAQWIQFSSGDGTA